MLFGLSLLLTLALHLFASTVSDLVSEVGCYTLDARYTCTVGDYPQPNFISLERLLFVELECKIATSMVCRFDTEAVCF